MIELKTVIDNNGYIIDECVEVKNGKVNYFILEDNQQIVDKYSNALGYAKPKWNGSEWVEGATEEEIQAYKEANKPTEKEPTIEELLIKEIANLKIEIMQLKGGNA